MQVIGLGTQDDFAFAQEFVDTGGLADSGARFLWEPGFGTWQAFDVRRNSSMTVLSADLTQTTPVFFGFTEAEQQQVLDILPELA